MSVQITVMHMLTEAIILTLTTIMSPLPCALSSHFNSRPDKVHSIYDNSKECAKTSVVAIIKIQIMK